MPENIFISESNMCFGPYSPEDVFVIEKSELMTSGRLSQDVKIGEFVLKRNNSLIIVEAKTTSPNAIEASSSAEKRAKYEKYKQDICAKMQNSLMVLANIFLKRYEAIEMPVNILNMDFSNVDFKFVLVIKNIERENLQVLRDALNRELRVFSKIWKAGNFLVLDEAMAIKKRLVRAE